MRHDLPTLLDIGDVAEITGCAKVTIWKWAKYGRFPCPVKLSPKATRWRSDHVRAWLEHISAGNPPAWPLPTTTA